jgi:hypothetical protein
VSAGSEQLCMQMPSAPRGRERISMVSGKIEEVSNRFVASPEAVRIEAVLGLSAKRKSLVVSNSSSAGTHHLTGTSMR